MDDQPTCDAKSPRLATAIASTLRSSIVRLLQALALAFALAAVASCNALSGIGELCADDCADSSATGGDAANQDENDPSLDGGGVLDGASTPCVDGERSCEGRARTECVAKAWQKMPCAETCVAGACAAWPSCRTSGDGGAILACGSGDAGASCCESKLVPGGTFNRQNNSALPATVSAFELDTFEVTVARFRAFVSAGGGQRGSPPPVGAGGHPKIANSGWQSSWNNRLPSSTTALTSLLLGGTWTSTPGANEQRPITNVPWFVAFAFCAWDGGRLPTYAEWNFAAAGGSDQRYYPWSSPASSQTISPTAHAVYTCAFASPAYSCAPTFCSNNTANSPCDAALCTAGAGTCQPGACTGCDATTDIAPVGSRKDGAGRWGHLDLAGNVAEILLDSRVEDKPFFSNDCNDCAPLMAESPINGQDDEHEVVFAGGAWDDSTSSVRTSSYDLETWDYRSSTGGLRCARNP